MSSEQIKNDYYKELHAASRHYDTKVWTIAGAFLIIIGWVLSKIDWGGEDFWTHENNAIILIFAAVTLFLLLLKFLKEHAYAIWIQKKINAMDEQFQGDSRSVDNIYDISKRHPLYSMPQRNEKEFSETDMIVGLKKKFGEDPYFRSLWFFEEWLIRFPISRVFTRFIALLSLAGFFMGIFILVKIWFSF